MRIVYIDRNTRDYAVREVDYIGIRNETIWASWSGGKISLLVSDKEKRLELINTALVKGYCNLAPYTHTD